MSAPLEKALIFWIKFFLVAGAIIGPLGIWKAVELINKFVRWV